VSGNDVTVEEACFTHTQAGPYSFTHARDLTGTIVINDGKALVVEYKLFVTV
jgi:hypothetical protein